MNISKIVREANCSENSVQDLPLHDLENKESEHVVDLDPTQKI